VVVVNLLATAQAVQVILEVTHLLRVMLAVVVLKRRLQAAVVVVPRQ
jgi:hypothetical protein